MRPLRGTTIITQRFAAAKEDPAAVGRRGSAPSRGEGGAPIVRLLHVAKEFRDVPGGTAALADVTMHVLAGQFVAVLGPSGCGKSTLLRIVAGLLPPTAGQVQVCGHPPDVARRAREYGMVFQAPVLYQWRTVLGNVELPLELAGVPKAERRARAREALALVRLEDACDRRPSQLSGGMQQRAAIARALVTQPRLLLMDEPFGALDELTRERLQAELLRIWHATGVTVLFVTHHIEEAVFLADRVLVLTERPSRVAAEIPIELARPRTDDTRDEATYFAAVRRVRAALRAPHADGTSHPQGPAFDPFA